MADDQPTAVGLLADLRAVGAPGEHPQRHYHGTADVLGVRMGTLFEIAKRYAAMPLDEVERLLDEPEYEPRLAAFCIMDFAVRGSRDDEVRRTRYELYLRRHDRIDTWDMVDRAAPRVVGEYLATRSRAPLFELAEASDPLRRRTAMTAPLGFLRRGDAEARADLFRLADRLLQDPDPVVSKPVGIALRHAGGVDPDGLVAFLDANAERMSRPLLRAASDKLPPGTPYSLPA
ncbi:DNA alkylation repair protein [Agromyces binzhouensis]|uniref:DNA alkylation repair protein n=1 Tax=Agromyces binzhouensis TaxID=1817495 RepID=A0A4Q2JQK2_9MICO|nr:DNA alkylation repair protein [Agromyces binzhouensis]RXZ48318.1 DNA alkylation repair protein [Agromyces binzhouensis]